jgi:hypothetical protein
MRLSIAFEPTGAHNEAMPMETLELRIEVSPFALAITTINSLGANRESF